MLPDLFRRLKPLYGKRIDMLWFEYETADMERKREIEILLTMIAVKRLGIAVGDERLVLDAPPPHVIGDGEFTIGHVAYPGLLPYPFRVKRNELLRHVFILGPTGTGKSTLLLGLLLQVAAAGVPFMIFDFKRNYRCLLRAPHDQLVVFTVGRETAPLLLNALLPPRGVGFEEWTEALADIISVAYLLMQGARNVLKESMLAAYREHGSAATLLHAHALLVRDLAICKSGSRRYGWLESSARSLEELTKGSFGRSLNTPGVEFHDLLTRQVIFELQGFGDDQKRCFCLLVLQAILLLRKNATAQREQLQHVLVFDEGHNVFPKEKFGELSVPARLAREVREYGEAIIAATQQADVSESLIANSGFKLILRCDFPRDVLFASQLLQIDQKWLPRLALGTGIARLPVRYYQPFAFTFVEQPIKNTTVTDEEVHAAWSRSFSARAPPPEPKPTAVSDREELLLQDIAMQPITPITQRYERLRWNPKTGNATKDSVIQKGLAIFESVSTPNAQVKILSLTEEGENYLRSQNITIPSTRRGGAEHEYWKWAIKNRLSKQGYNVTEEHPVGGGKTVDLHAQRGSEVIWIEVETGRSDILANFEKCRALSGRKLFIFTSTQLRGEYATRLPDGPDLLLLTTSELEHLT